MRSTMLLAALLAGCKGDEERGPDVAISTDAVEFGLVGLGAEASQELVISNEGGDVLEVLSVTLVDGDTDVWRNQQALADLGPGESLVVTVTFHPEREEQEYGRLQIRTNDPDEASLTVELSGVGGPSEADDDGDGFSPAQGDCDDSRWETYPGADEICDGRDNDCDGTTPSDEADADGDGVRVCADDCDDGDNRVAPGLPEICDDKDSDCDGVSADRDDRDGDGFAICDDDCDDEEAAVYPGAAEACDGLDNDCTGVPDDLDGDSDGHSPCMPAGDCDDANAAAYPVVVDAAASSGTADGTDANPFTEVGAALDALDSTCRTVYVVAGEYEVAETISAVSGRIVIQGEGMGETVLRAASGSRLFNVASAKLELRDLTLTGGDASGDGGAIRATDAEVDLYGVELVGNRCTGDGGALSIASSTSSIVRDSVFADNVADDDGGAVASLASTFDDQGSTWTNNSGVRGGALLLESSYFAVLDATFDGNTASDEGGAIAITNTTEMTLRRNLFWRNTAGSGGGAVVIDDATSGDVHNNRFQDNEGGLGGGLAIGGARAAFEVGNNTFAGNASTGNGACAHVGATDASGLVLSANVLGWCDGPSGLHVGATSLALPSYNTVFATSTGTNYSGLVLDGVDGNDAVNPGFVAFTDDGDPEDDDLSLTTSSPMRDSGPPDSSWDDTDGSQNDRGHTGGPHAR